MTDNILWTNGSYECGKWPDISIFRNALLSNLDKNERVEADDGYVGEASNYIKCPKSFVNHCETIPMQARIRSKQETVTKRFKNRGMLKQVFRHLIPHHGHAFTAIAVLSQLTITNGENLFDCGYRDSP